MYNITKKKHKTMSITWKYKIYNIIKYKCNIYKIANC